MKNILNAAVIGTGFVGPVHIEALRRLGIPVVGVMGSSPERAAPKAAQWGIARVYADMAELVADPAVDVVHITSPNRFHLQQAKIALQAGKHVVCEKPLAMTAEEGAELVALARSTGLVNAINHNIRFYSLNQHAHKLASGGELGDVRIIRGQYVQDWLVPDTAWNWRLLAAEGGRMRTVGDVGTHWLDLTTFITGLRVQRVFADVHTFLPVRRRPLKPVETFVGKTLEPDDYQSYNVDTEDYASILLQYEGGARGVVTVCQMAAGRKNQLYYEINGSEKSLAWNQERPNELWIGRWDAPNRTLIKDPAAFDAPAASFADYPAGHAEGYPDTFKQLYKAVYDYIRAGDFSAPPDFPTFADGLAGMRLVDAIAQSAAEGRWVDVPGD